MKKVLLKIGLFFSVLLLLLAVIAGIGAYRLEQYLTSNETKILDALPFLSEGQVSFQKVEVSLFDNFPKASVNFHQFQIIDSANLSNNRPFLKAEQLTCHLSLKDWRQRKLALQNLVLKNGT
ncbi:MAG: hypothetical protein AAGJ18_25880, partial [Bacteroidota bacterium]